eukprot:71348-Pyramimonas_sp.AAC.1
MGRVDGNGWDMWAPFSPFSRVCPSIRTTCLGALTAPEFAPRADERRRRSPPLRLPAPLHPLLL